MSDGRWRRVYSLNWLQAAVQGLNNDERIVWLYCLPDSNSTAWTVFQSRSDASGWQSFLDKKRSNRIMPFNRDIPKTAPADELADDSRQRGRLEYADMRRDRGLGLTAYRLQLIRHSTCACGSPATCLHSGFMRCDACFTWERTKRRFQTMTGK